MAGSATAHDRLKVFLSYSRHDMAVADRMVEALEEAGFAVTIDRRDLPYGEEWQAELADFIRTADTVVWLVSSASLQSRWCAWELGEVQRTNKRLMPVAIESVAPEALPEALGRIHLLPAEGAFDFERDLPKLATALNTDGAWLKDHTRLADRARQWLARDRSPALLLRGIALKDAQAWADRKPPGAPSLSDDISQILIASRLAQSRRQRTTIVGSIAAAIVGLGLAGVATWQWREADVQRVSAVANFNAAGKTIEQVATHIAITVEGSTSETDAFRAITETIAEALETLNASGSSSEAFPAADGYHYLGMLYESIGDLDAAVASHQASIAILEASPPSADGTSAASLSNQHTYIGDLLMLQGDAAAALARYETALNLDRSSEAGDFALSIAHRRVGEALNAVGDTAGALSHYRIALRFSLSFAKLIDDVRYLHYASVNYDGIGDVLRTKGDLAEAEASYTAALEIRKRIAAADTGVNYWRSDISESYGRIASVQAALGDHAAAIASLRAAVDTMTTLVALEPGKPQWRRILARHHEALGNTQVAGGDTVAALSNYETALSLRQLATVDGESDQDKTELARSLNDVARLLVVTGREETRDRLKALALSRQANELTGWKKAAYLETVAAAYADNGNFAEAALWQEKALEDPEFADGNTDAINRLTEYQEEAARHIEESSTAVPIQTSGR